MIKEEPVLWLLLNCKGSHRYQVRTGDPLGSCYKSVGWLAATTFRLFLDLVAVSVSSFCVGSTDTFLGFPSVTREEAMAMPGNNIRWLLSRYQSPELTWSAWWSVAVTSSGHPHYQGQHGCPVTRTRLQRYRTRTRLLTSFSGQIWVNR